MGERNSHCSFCGAAFAPAAPWPRQCRACGNISYLNPLPVVVVLVPVGTGLVAIRRDIEPSKGTLTLPGGYLEIGESWQEGGKRELREETGIDLGAAPLRLYEVMNGLDGTLVIFGLAEALPELALRPFRCAETREVVRIEGPVELGFPLHTEVVRRYFAEGGQPPSPRPSP
ncbi:NUDIX hydrolase [Desulfuromonas versatilis]|uniref:NUDIX hydrolase n=1 Tax=Desulfuromonas versatilis TaxID=2802975 RepID=A0ABM8HRT1_9BACT|nr:NUDIX domain-containing protein [Desulfuromonas versatilis]BCR03323.1 NUDIX hydrolase [Desulfuromonas versatilis]